MQRVDGQIVLSPTDLTKHLACPHVTTLDLAAADGPDGPDGPDGTADGTPDGAETETAADDALHLVFAKGLEHERAFLERLRREGRQVVTIEAAFDLRGRRDAEARTVEAMQAGADVIYQGTFFDGSWGGQADFLLRTESPSRLGPWSYEIADTKLARRLKVPALLQMATYAERLSVLQGAEPSHLYVVTGDGDRRTWRLLDVAAYARRARALLRQAVDERPATEPVPASYCAQCRWSTRCTDEWVRADDLSLVAFMRADHRAALRASGVETVTALATRSANDLPQRIGRPSRERLAQQARLQVRTRDTGVPCYELLPPQPGLGLLCLPVPSPGDVYLDFEGDPYADGGEGREYLAGLGDRDVDETGGFTALWAHTRDEERVLTEQLVDELLRWWEAEPGMHVYHYAPYEVTALKRLTARHGTREAELDQLLRAEVFVDLYAVVRHGLRVGLPSYSIKKLEAFYWEEQRGGAEVAAAMDSVVAYERWLAEHDDQELRDIEAYNRADVVSTRDLHRWLEGRRAELEAVHGVQPRPHEVVAEPSPEVSDAQRAEERLARRLLDAGHPLLAGLVSWHRREGRPQWWDFFRLASLTDEELVRDGAAIGDVSAPAYERPEKRSRLFRYTFPPQDTKVSVGSNPVDVETRAPVGEVFELDAAAGCLLLKVGPGKEAPQVRGFGPPGPPRDAVLRAAVGSVAEDTLAGRRTLGQALLDRCVPPGTRPRDGESPTDAVVRVGRTLDGHVLAVQGPPGSGKTTVGARLVRALLDDGLTVGVTALSHKVIGGVLSEVGRPAVQKCGDGEFCGAPGVTQVTTNEAVVAALASGATLVGGTSWLWAREDLRASVDVLLVDEAGQFSLANAVAVSTAARSLVLLGDPQQLAQPSQAHHPDGAGVSALEHLLDGHATVPPDRGVFLDRTWRMHPAVTTFVSDTSYEGRLRSVDGRERQEVTAPGRLTGHGLRLVPVAHSGCEARSDEEAEVVAGLVADLLRGWWTDAEGRTHPLCLDDVLVVAPYNSQVGRLRTALPGGARVGTVDKFQGRQAPVVLYSTASSSAADAPRGVDFLYDLHRLNVAVSRAKALVALVMNPRLLDAAVRTPEQLRLVNALCLYGEQASWV